MGEKSSHTDGHQAQTTRNKTIYKFKNPLTLLQTPITRHGDNPPVTKQEMEIPEQLENQYQEYIKDIETTGETAAAQKLRNIKIKQITEEETYQEIENIISDPKALSYLQSLKEKVIKELGLTRKTFDIEKYKDLKKNEIAQKMADYVLYTKNIQPVDIGTKQEMTRLYEYNNKTGLWEEYSKNRIKRLCKELAQQEFSQHMKNSFRDNLLAHPDYIKHEEMGTPEHLLPLQNGKKLDISDLSDLKNLPQKEIEKEDYALHSINANYKPEADCPKFKEFVEFLLNGEKKQVKTLQEFMGWLLKFPNRDHKKALLILGVSNSGKSQLLEAVEELFKKEVGDTVSGLTMPQIAQQKRYHLHKLSDSIVNLDKDLSSNNLEEPANIKVVISQEKTEAKPMYEGAMWINPNAKFMVAANLAPQIENETDDAFYGRFLTLKAPNTVPRSQRVTDLGKKLYEQEAEGILMWMLEGLKRLEQQGEFTLEMSPYETKMSWLEFGDDVHRFIWEQCELTEDMEDAVPKDELYEYYERWSQGKMMEKTPKNQFKGRVGDMMSISNARARSKDIENNELVTHMDQRIFRGIRLDRDKSGTEMEDDGDDSQILDP